MTKKTLTATDYATHIPRPPFTIRFLHRLGIHHIILTVPIVKNRPPCQFYACKCPTHGWFRTWAQGYDGRLQCPTCGQVDHYLLDEW